MSFKKIGVIGAGTMGSGIAGQIANAGHQVLLLDLPADDDPLGVVKGAVKRLIKSDPPALMHKDRADLIELGNIRDDFDKLADCDWIVEAIVERLPLKKDLYKRLNDVISPDCIVTSNTSTIPIKLLVEDMPIEFRKRFAITHYFNPVRYMRLLELVRGVDTDAAVMDRLADYNDRVLGKGVVQCGDTPGFLGNRVGVFALQVGMDEAAKNGLNIEDADALMGRPMGIPKTGVFGLYDLIGVDLMSDVVKTLEDILPAGDAFYAVGKSGPLAGVIKDMVASGFTGQKGKGGFYSLDDARARDIKPGDYRPKSTTLPPKAIKAAANMAANRETLIDIITGDASDPHTKFTRNFLARVLGYAASLIPAITNSPQDIDDAMKLGFNWVRGPFEMIDAIGADTIMTLMSEAGLEIPEILNGGTFYAVDGDTLTIRHADGQRRPIALPENTVRFSLMRQTLTPIVSNASASLFALPNDLRLIEFHSKANALTGASMEIVAAAARDHGRGIIVHNDAQHFSAGVDLNSFRKMIEAGDWDGIDSFLFDFQMAVKALKYTPVPVIGAPSGLGIGGGFEVLAHCDAIIAHDNSVLGLVECGVGVVPSGGGVKETYGRWLAQTNDPDKAAWETWMQVGYGKTGTSPELSAPLQYFLPERDTSVMNRDKLVHAAIQKIEEMAPTYTPPTPPTFTLAGNAIIPKMADFMQGGVDKGWFFPHDKTTAMAVATIVCNTQGPETLAQNEDQMYARERAAFIQLAKTPETLARIASMLDDGAPIRN